MINQSLHWAITETGAFNTQPRHKVGILTDGVRGEFRITRLDGLGTGRLNVMLLSKQQLELECKQVRDNQMESHEFPKKSYLSYKKLRHKTP